MSRHRMTRTRYPGVYRRTDGRLVLRVSVTSPKTGKPVERSRLLPECTTLAEARGLVDDLAAEARGDRVAVALPTIGAYARHWLTRKIQRGDWRLGSTTATNNIVTLQLHVLPDLGDIIIDRLETRDLVAWMDAQLASGAKPGTIRSRWTTLRSLVMEACSDYQLPDITRAVRPPRKPARGGRDMALMPAQVREALAWVAESEPAWECLVWLGFASGARLSELCPAQVGDLELTDEVGRWTIRRHYGRGSTILPGSKAGPERTVYLDPVTTATLRDRLARRADDAWVTVVMRSGMMQPPSRGQIEDFMRVMSAGLGVAVTTKTFRQTHNTLSRLAGVALAVVHEQIGHTSEAMSNVYTRIPSEARESAARQWADVIELPRRASGGNGAGNGRSE